MADGAIDSGQLDLASSLLDEGDQLMSSFDDGIAVMHERFALVRSRLAAALDADPAGNHLTERELDVLGLLPGTLSISEIAHQLYLSPNTVKTHTRAIYRKLGASSRDEAVRIARGRRLV